MKAAIRYGGSLLLVLLPFFERLYDTSAYLPLGIGVGLCAACCVFRLVRNEVVCLTKTDLAAGLCLLYPVGRAVFCETTSPASFFLFLYAALLYVWARLVGERQHGFLLFGLVAGGVLQAVIAWLQYIKIIPSMHGMFTCTGTFLHPAPLGGWLSMGMIAAWSLWMDAKGFSRKTKVLVGISLLLIGSALILTDSRASWVACSVTFLLMCMKRRTISGWHQWVVFILLVFVLSLALYRYRRPSADARLFIWKVCTEMAKESPIFGHGPQGIKRCYMHFQADYLAEHGTEHEQVQATDNSLAFNEGVRIVCEYGLVGCLLMFLLLVLAWMESRRGSLFKWLLLGLLVFSLFSYPSEVFSLLSVFFLVLGCLPNGTGKSIRMNKRLSMWLFSVPILSGLIYVYVGHRANHALDHFCWDEDAEKEWLHCYPLFRNECEPVSRYAHTLVLNGEYESAIEPLEQMTMLAPTVEIYCDLGYCYQYVGEPVKAESCYRYALSMAPGRIMPHYRLFCLYRSLGNQEKMHEAGLRILSMKVKIENDKVRQIRREVKDVLEL